MTTTATRTRKTAEQRKHDHYLDLAVLVRQGRLIRMVPGVKRASLTLNGEHVDVYASNEYPGWGYIVRDGECSCEGYEYRHQCTHSKSVSARAKARYEAAKRQQELDAAAVVAPLALGAQFASELTVHLEDELSAQAEAIVAEERRGQAALNGSGAFSLMRR
jgi:hypothetical protein